MVDSIPSWFYVYYARFSEYSVMLYGINEYDEDVEIEVDTSLYPGASRLIRRVWFVGNSDSAWTEMRELYGRPVACGDEEWKYYSNTAPITNLNYETGTLFSIDLPEDDAKEFINNSTGLGIACLYQSMARKALHVAFELSHRQTSVEKNMYGWIEILLGPSMRCKPMDILRHDASRPAPNMYAIAYDIEMVHASDECEHAKCVGLGYCHGVPDASVKGDYVNILTAVMWRVCNKPEIISRLRILNCYASSVKVPDGYEMWDGADSIEPSENDNFVVSSDEDVARVFLLWSDCAHMIMGWNITKFDNIQMLRIVKNVYELAKEVDARELAKLNGEDIGSFLSRERFRFAKSHQMTIEGQQMGLLYRMLHPNQKSLRQAAIALGAGTKMDVSMREMELHWREWLMGAPMNMLYVDYCLQDSMLVYNMFRDIHIEMMFAVNVASNLEQLNLCHSRLPYCEPLFHRRQLERRQVYDARIRFYGNMYPMYTQTFMQDYLRGFEQSKEKKKYPGAIVSAPVQGMRSHVAAVDFASLYPNNERQYSLSDGTAWPLSEELAAQLDGTLFHKIPIELGKYKLVLCSLRDDTRTRQGCLAAYMSYCLEYRAEIKKMQGKEPKGSPRWVQLEANQLTVKRAANGQYGITGMPQWSESTNNNFASAIAFAAGITAIGRKFLKAAQVIVLEMGLKPIYSDTDSVYVETRMNCKELANTVNAELAEMYYANDFSRRGIESRGTLGKPATKPPILLQLAGEANYLWMSQVYKKRYICLYDWESHCKICDLKHNGILFKGGPSHELMRFAHETILEAHRMFVAGEDVHRYLSAVLRKVLSGSEPAWRIQNAQPLDSYTKSTPAIHVRHANALATSLGNNTGEIEFCSIFPERYYTGKVPKALNDVSFPCIREELPRIYRGKALQLEIAGMTFLTDMRKASSIRPTESTDTIAIEGDDDVEAPTEDQYEIAEVRNEHIRQHVRGCIEEIKQWILMVSRRGHTARLYLLSEKMICKKRNFNQLFYAGIYMPRIHSHLQMPRVERMPYTRYGTGRRLAGATISEGINITRFLDSDVQVEVSGAVEEEIVLASELLGLKVPRIVVREGEISIVEAIWGWYLVHDVVTFYPYAMLLVDALKMLNLS